MHAATLCTATLTKRRRAAPEYGCAVTAGQWQWRGACGGSATRRRRRGGGVGGRETMNERTDGRTQHYTTHAIHVPLRWQQGDCSYFWKTLVEALVLPQYVIINSFFIIFYYFLDGFRFELMKRM